MFGLFILNHEYCTIVFATGFSNSLWNCKKNILKIHLSCNFDTVTVGKNSKFLFLRYSDVYQTHTPPPSPNLVRERQTDRQTNRLNRESERCYLCWRLVVLLFPLLLQLFRGKKDIIHRHVLRYRLLFF